MFRRVTVLIPLQHSGDDGLGRIVLHQMSRHRNLKQPTTGQESSQPLAGRYGYPAILLAPQDLRWTIEPSIEWLNFVGVFAIHLRDLAIEGCLSFDTTPRTCIDVHRFS